MNKAISQTRYKVLFNNLLIKSGNYVKFKVFWNNGLTIKVYPIENTIINKQLLRV